MQRLDEADRLYIHLADLLALCLQPFLCDELFGIHLLRLPMFVLPTEDYLKLRMSVLAEFHQERTFRIGNEIDRSIVTDVE